LGLFITLIEIKESVIYDGPRQVLVQWEGRIHHEIELNDAANRIVTIESLEISL